MKNSFIFIYSYLNSYLNSLLNSMGIGDWGFGIVDCGLWICDLDKFSIFNY